MKATFAFLVDTNIHNQVWRLAWELHRTYMMYKIMPLEGGTSNTT